MKAYLFGWNPRKFAWSDMAGDIKKLADSGKLEDNWSVISHKAVRPGDRAFIVRVGVEPKGIFASGIIASLPYPAFGNGRNYYRVTIALDVLLNPDKERILTLDILKTGSLAGQNWTPQASGISVRQELVDQVEQVWLNFLSARDEMKGYF